MNPLEYLRLQLRLEGKEIVHGDRLRQVEVIPEEDIALMVIAQLADKQVVAYYDESLASELHKELVGQIQNIQLPTIEPLLAVLHSRRIPVDVGHYKTYLFPKTFQYFIDRDVDFRSSVGQHVQMYCIERDGKLVASCVSSRENAQCAEAWVHTEENYRRQGLAQRVVGAWAKAMFDAGKAPFYSHKITNLESASLAKRLGLEPVLEEIAVSYMNV